MDMDGEACVYLGMKKRQAPHCVERQQHFHQELFVFGFERESETIDDAVKSDKGELCPSHIQ